MNKSKLKAYAPQARKDFIAVVSARANQLGLSANEILPSERRGDVMLIAGRSWPANLHTQREKLVARIRTQGFTQVMEAAAYGWFNRFAALRYMELHDYLNHGYRVLSNPDGALPEILQHVQNVDLPGLNKEAIKQLQLAGNKDGEIYRQVLLAQCNALHAAMPFLFEKLDDETELLLPDNLLLTDSVVAKLVNEIDEADWQQVEIIGWLYQFYISEKKDEVIGSVVKSEDIPAATQLFTPNWIVKYLVQNSVGRLWLQANPTSTLANQWEYYIQPAEQTPEVNAQLDALIKARIAEDGDVLKPESITVLDPACGSGHILVEAYDLLKAIYLERGYRLRDIPKLILQHNLFGLDIDDRAAQLAGFALLMKARADDRRLFEATPTLHVMALQESQDLDDEKLGSAVFESAITIEGGEAIGTRQLFGGGQLATEHSSGLRVLDLRDLIQFFAHAKTFGSLLVVPPELMAKLPKLDALLVQVVASGDALAKVYALQIQSSFLIPAKLLSKQYDAVVANPPYMGSKYLNTKLREFAKDNYPVSKSDLFAVSIERYVRYVKPTGFSGFMTPFTWMFLSSFEGVRDIIHGENTLQSLIQPQYHTFFESAAVPVCAFTLQNTSVLGYTATFIKLSEFRGAELQPIKALEALRNKDCGWIYTAKPDDFKYIPSKPIAYWVPEKVIRAFSDGKKIEDYAEAKQGLITGDNDRFLRHWYEVSLDNSALHCNSRFEASASNKMWFPFQKGGAFRKWFGNHLFLVNWKHDGSEIRSFFDDNGKLRSRPQSLDYYFKEGVTWTSVTISTFNCRFSPVGFIYSEPGPVLYTSESNILFKSSAFLNSKPANYLLQLIAPAMHYNQGHVSCLPLPELSEENSVAVVEHAKTLIRITEGDWNSYEQSWNFQKSPLIHISQHSQYSLSQAYNNYIKINDENIKANKSHEEEINSIFINALELSSELDPSVSNSQITLTVNPEYRYEGEVDLSEKIFRFRNDSATELISYIVGCMMGRYSLDEPGLIYAHAGNIGFDESRYKTFTADADGILPVTDELWFDDDAANRIREFLKVVWGEATLEENMAWLAESLGVKGDETPDETIRRYISGSFYKDHMQTYKKRPIYWMFSSGKQGAFKALVYLHRYNEGTLARMRSEYVVPLTGKMQSRIALLEQDRDAATATTTRNKISKQIEGLRKKHIELLNFDERLRHYADMRITLDLDDGVKVNYGKFGDLLDSVKAITGGDDD